MQPSEMASMQFHGSQISMYSSKIALTIQKCTHQSFRRNRGSKILELETAKTLVNLGREDVLVHVDVDHRADSAYQLVGRVAPEESV